jgi:hypothetical protein
VNRKKVRILDIYQKEAKGKREITFFESRKKHMEIYKRK